MKVGITGYGSMGRMLLEKLSLNSDLIDGKLYVANRSHEKTALKGKNKSHKIF